MKAAAEWDGTLTFTLRGLHISAAVRRWQSDCCGMGSTLTYRSKKNAVPVGTSSGHWQ